MHDPQVSDGSSPIHCQDDAPFKGRNSNGELVAYLFATSALGRALLARNFEVALFLHAGQPTYCEPIRRKMQLALATRCKQSSGSKILLTWFNENNPPLLNIGRACKGEQYGRLLHCFDSTEAKHVPNGAVEAPQKHKRYFFSP